MNFIRKSFILLGTLLIFIFSCNSENDSSQNAELEAIYLEKALSDIRENIPLSELVEDVEYIKLESSEECIINKIERLVLFENHIFISNKGQFFQFSKSGKFIRKFGSKGKGPGEYIYISNFAIHPESNLISIYDSELKKIMNYDKEGNFLDEIQIDGYPNLIAYDKLGNLSASWVLPMFFYNDSYCINSYDDRGNIMRKIWSREDEGINANNVGHIPSTSRTRFEYFNDTLSYWEVNYPSIIRIVNGEIIPRYNIIGNFTPKMEDLNSPKIQENKFVFSDLLETSRFIFMTKGVHNNDIYHILYDKSLKKVNAFQVSHEDPRIRLHSGFINDIDGGYPFFPSGLISKDKAYCSFFPYEMKNMLSEKFFSQVEIKNKDGHEQLLELLEDSNLEDNPIIMIAKFKSI